MKKILVLFLLVSGFAFGQSKKSTEKSERVVQLLVDRNFKEVSAMADSGSSSKLDTMHLKMSWSALTRSSGNFEKIDSMAESTQPPFNMVLLRCKFEKRQIDIRTLWNGDKLRNVSFSPVETRFIYQHPVYFDSTKYVEKRIVINTGDDIHLPGTLTIPTAPGKHPLAILIHGSGPNDRDETVGAIRIFKDLSFGLANHNIAVLRYEKRSRIYKAKLYHQKIYTVDDEVISDVVSAINLASMDSSIDVNNIFLIGHGFGGYLLPKIVKATKGVKGLILLAANSNQVEDVYVDQTAYALQESNFDAKYKEHVMDSLKNVQAQIHRFSKSSLNDSTWYFMAPPAYWVDLHNYNAIKEAGALTQPMFLLYGMRDYQVTSKETSAWQTGLKSKSNAEFKIYPKLNHFFIAGEGKSTPAEYGKQGNVDVDVINDIAVWITGKSK